MRKLSAGLLAVVLLAGCAVQRTKAPQIDAKTAFALNLETQVTQGNKDYTMLFADIGEAHRQGKLTDGDVSALNVIGMQLRSALTEADRLTKVYATNYDNRIAEQIGGLLAQVASDIAQITNQKAAALAGSHQ